MRLLISFLFLFFLGKTAYCEEPLKVGVVEFPSFVIKQGNIYSGIAIDIWDEIALKLNRKTQFVNYSRREQAFDALEKNEIDIFVAPLSITLDRYKKVEYTLPFFLDKIVVVSPRNYLLNTYFFIKIFFWSVGGILFLFITLYLVYLSLLWYYEHSQAETIPHEYKEGISFLFWNHILSGHHNELPKTLGGKAAILFQKGTIYFLALFLNAGLISFLTAYVIKHVSPVQNISDLENMRVGALKGGKPYGIALNNGLRVMPFESIDEGIKALQSSKINAYISDFSIMETYLSQNAIADLEVSHFALRLDLYAFATPIGSSLTRKVNIGLLELKRYGIPQKIIQTYLPRAKTWTQL